MLKPELFKNNIFFCPKMWQASKLTLNFGQFEQISVSYTGFTEHINFADTCTLTNRNAK